ncbi:MAG: hypothetical protein A2314_00920 [Elusimicrobia bacterium RIFOXYB2_FULL_50_12]|nr:MAG: hypothetical protein A2314_00920 [Elusimicrobia bacterium RIFOXYB2_FULL_50_12]
MADVIVTSDDNYLVDVDHDSSSSANYFGVTHDNGAELFRVQENGKVGIGTTTPDAAITVKDDAGLSAGEHFLANVLRTTSDAQLLLGYRADGTVVTSNLIRSANSLPLTFGTSSQNQAVIVLDDGKVGIGTASPVQKLHVAGGSIYVQGEVGIRKENPAGSLHVCQGFNTVALILENSGGTKFQIRDDGTMKWTIENDSDGQFSIHSESTNYILSMYQNGKVAVGGLASPQIDGKLHVVSGHITLEEISAPSNAPTNCARIFCRDNGSGKTQLCVIFPSGTVQVIATEPS